MGKEREGSFVGEKVKRKTNRREGGSFFPGLGKKENQLVEKKRKQNQKRGRWWRPFKKVEEGKRRRKKGNHLLAKVNSSKGGATLVPNSHADPCQLTKPVSKKKGYKGKKKDPTPPNVKKKKPDKDYRGRTAHNNAQRKKEERKGTCQK